MLFLKKLNLLKGKWYTVNIKQKKGRHKTNEEDKM